MSRTLAEAMNDACNAIGVEPPRHQPAPGRFTRTDTKGKNGKADASILIFDDQRGGIVWNHQTAVRRRFGIGEAGNDNAVAQAPKRDLKREREEQEQRRIVERVCADLVSACRQDVHPYLDRKGFPTEPGLVHDDPREVFPTGRFGEVLGKALPEGDGPFLIIPGRIDGKLKTLQFITPEGAKKNILRGQMTGASHRIATGRDTWVCEGIATAMSVRAALKLLGQSATVLCAFSASNVGKVAEAIPGSRIAADHDKPVEGLENLGAGEFYARRSRRKWVMPSKMGDFNDLHLSTDLRQVALELREFLLCS